MTIVTPLKEIETRYSSAFGQSLLEDFSNDLEDLAARENHAKLMSQTKSLIKHQHSHETIIPHSHAISLLDSEPSNDVVNILTHPIVEQKKLEPISPWGPTFGIVHSPSSSPFPSKPHVSNWTIGIGSPNFSPVSSPSSASKTTTSTQKASPAIPKRVESHALSTPLKPQAAISSSNLVSQTK